MNTDSAVGETPLACSFDRYSSVAIKLNDPGKVGGLSGERLGNCSRRCPTSCIHAVVGNRSRHCPTSSAAVPDAALPPPSMESCIHAVVKGASNTVSRLKAAHITPSPFQGEGGDGGAMLEQGHT